MKIKEVCKRTGLTEKSVRYYVEQGLCTPKQAEVRGRVYSEFSGENLRELSQVIRLRTVGLSIEQIQRVKAGGDIPSIMNEHRAALEEELRRKQRIADVIGGISFEGGSDIAELSEVLLPAIGKEPSPPDFSRFEDISVYGSELGDIEDEPWYQHGRRLAGAVLFVILISTMVAVTSSLGIIVFLCSAFLFMKKRSGYLALFRILALLGIAVNTASLHSMAGSSQNGLSLLLSGKTDGELVYLIIIAAECAALLLLCFSKSLKEYLRA